MSFLTILGVVGVAIVFAVVLFYKSDLTTRELARMYMNPASKFIMLPNGAVMHYRDEGNSSGPVLVLIHGGLASLHNWEQWVKILQKEEGNVGGFRLISMDLLGHGLTGPYPANLYDRISQRNAVHQLLEALNVSQYTVVGNSFGGGVALEMALEYPNNVKGLILLDSEGIPNGPDGYDASSLIGSEKKVVTPQDAAFTKTTWWENFGSMFIGPEIVKSVLEDMVYDKGLLTNEFVEFFSRILRHSGNREIIFLFFRQGLYLIQQNGPQDLLPRLGELKMPTLILNGKQDGLVPVQVAQTFHEKIAHSKLVLINHCGHLPMIEKPKESSTAVRTFFKEHEVGS